MSQLGFTVYRFLSRVSPKVRSFLVDGAASRFIKRHFFDDPNGLRLAEAQIEWENLSFYFRAPYSWLRKAKSGGIESRICRLAKSVLKPGDTAVDVGANYGFCTLVLARSVSPSGRVFAFEIDPQIAEVLSASALHNRLEQVVTVVRRGAGAKLNSNGFVAVDTILENKSSSRIKFLKIDTDGSDHDVLLGCVDILERFYPVVAIEMTSNQDDIYELLRQCGYRYFMDQAGKPIAKGNWPENLIASTDAITIPPRGSFIR